MGGVVCLSRRLIASASRRLLALTSTTGLKGKEGVPDASFDLVIRPFLALAGFLTFESLIAFGEDTKEGGFLAEGLERRVREARLAASEEA